MKNDSQKDLHKDVMEKIVSLSKRRGFVFLGSEIYGGLAGTFDWGHFGGRSWGLWFFFVFLIGAPLVGLAVIFVFFWISSLVDPD